MLALLGGCGSSSGGPDAAPDASGLDRWEAVFSGLTDGALTSAWGTGDDLFVVGGKQLGSGGGLILHYDGQSWTHMTNPAPALLWWVHGFAKNDVWAVGQAGAIVHYDGSSWQLLPSGTTGVLSGVWGADSGELWAVGGTDSAPVAPLILRWNGATWQPADPGPIDNGGTLFKVWGTDRSHVVAVGDRGVVLRWNGSTWMQQTRVTGAQLITVHGSALDDVWVVGGTGNAAVLHDQGQGFVPLQDTGLLPPLLGVFAQASGPLVVVGRQGFIGTRAPGGSEWHAVADVPTTDCLHNVAPYAGGFVAVGGNLLSPGAGLHGVVLRSGSSLSSTLH
jgi:hypothetical protein